MQEAAAGAAPARGRPGVLQLLLPVAWAGSLVGLASGWGWFAGAAGALEWIGVSGRALAILLGGVATGALVRSVAREGLSASLARDLPDLLACGLLALAAGTAFDALGAGRFWVGSAFGDALVLGLSAQVLPGARGAPRRPLARVLLVNVAAVLLAAEAVLAIYARVRPHPLLASGSDPVRRMESLRLRPGAPYFGFPANSGGYHDTEFSAGRPGDLVVAVLADSFGVGIVPYRFNFVTIAEEILRERLAGRFERVAINNFAVSGVGMNEYAYLLDHEVERWRPDHVVLAVFVGNDIHRDARFGEAPRRDRRSLLRWKVWGVPRGLWSLVREGPRATPDTGSPARATSAVPEHVRDPAREPPTFTPQTFLRLESRRFEVCNPDDADIEAAYASLFRGLEHFRDRLGDRLLVVVIPDELQVNDALYQDLLTRAPERGAWPRDLPQRRIAAFCEREGIACLDLLPVLRHAQRRGHTYHLRDTHLNAHGNAVAGRALAEALAERL